MRGKPIHIQLTAEETATLRMWLATGKTEQRMAGRARAILLSAERLSMTEISQRSNLSPQSCTKWRKRFLESGIDGLADPKRRGRPPMITPEERHRVIALACSTPPDGNTAWSIRKLAKHVGFSSATIHRILSEGALKPHRVDNWCGKSPDPEFE